jgi:hypothetical protein
MAQLNPVQIMQLAPAMLVLVQELMDVMGPQGLNAKDIGDVAYALQPLLVRVKPSLGVVPPEAFGQVVRGILDLTQGLGTIYTTLAAGSPER